MTYLTDDWRLGTCDKFKSKILISKYNSGCFLPSVLKKEKAKQKLQRKVSFNMKKLALSMENHFPTEPVNLRSFRLPSDLLLFYTEDSTSDWYEEIWEDIEARFVQAGKAVLANNIRLSSHTPRVASLAGISTSSIEKAIKEIEYRAMLGQKLGIPANEYTVTVYLQGLYNGTRKEGIKRFASNFQYLSDYAQQALSVENEDKPKLGYDIEDVLDLCAVIPTRATFNLHHYERFRHLECEYPTVDDDFFKQAVNTWKGVRPLFSVSQEQKNGDSIRYQSDMLEDRGRLENLAPMLDYADFNIEATCKEIAVRDVYQFVCEQRGEACL